nr:hypothetical protein CFP56_44237 [Quercus suber]
MGSSSQALFVSPEPEDTHTAHRGTMLLTSSAWKPGQDETPDEADTSMLSDSDHETNDHDDEEDCMSLENWGHNPSDEPLPAHAAFDQGVPGIKLRVMSEVQQIMSILELHSGGSKDLLTIVESAEERLREVEVPKKTFGVVGDTGMGKSATISSITGIFGLAKASCTHVVTIYKHKLDFQDPETTPFAAEIRYLDIKECEAFLGEQLHNYNRFEFETEEDWDPEQIEKYKQLRDQAFAVFRSLFCDREECESPRAAAEFLQESYNDRDKPALANFVAWCAVHFKSLDTVAEAPIRRFSAQTLEELNEFLEPHVYQKMDVQEPVLCALIDHVS